MIITNVVYSANLRCELELKKLCYRLTNVSYNPAKFPGLVWKHKRIGGNCLVFSSWVINCNGFARDFKSGYQRLRRYARCLQKLGYPVQLTDVKRLTASAYQKLSSPLSLEKLSSEWKITYTPEIFPALVIKKQGVTFSCFHSGTVVITGIKRQIDMDDIIFPTLIELELYTR